MEPKTYTIRRGDEHLPHSDLVELQVHQGPRLKVAQAQDYRVELTPEQARQLEADGYLVNAVGGAAAPVAESDPTLPPWPLKTSPADYLDQHANDDSPSPEVQERLALAQRHVDAGEGE